EQILHEAESQATAGWSARVAQTLPSLIERMARTFGVRETEILGGSRRRPVARARAAMSAIAVRSLGLPATRVAQALGVTAMAVLRGVDRGLGYLRERRLDPERLAKEVIRKV
ncbi:MAG: hypothetical protein HY766_14410, partial [candidate division NC10 bacterium]|nr:hypothetical protein [candidate division NC10 bacterium]